MSTIELANAIHSFKNGKVVARIERFFCENNINKIIWYKVLIYIRIIFLNLEQFVAPF
jgi:hypothetical protein